MPSRKRSAESADIIDLTDDNSIFSSSQPGSQPSSQAFSQPSSQLRAPKQARVSSGTETNPYTIDDEEDVHDGSQEAPDASQSYNEAEYQYDLYGVMSTKIVGVRYYNGIATLNEMVILRREPQNPYDSNAIQVLNVQSQQIGHIPRNNAMKLAKYMDNRSILIEGYITGRKGEFDCPIELRLYGTIEHVERSNLIAQMKADRLPVQQADARRRREEREEKERQKIASQAAKRAKKKGGAIVGIPGQDMDWENSMGQYAAGSSQGFGLGPGMEEIIKGSERFTPRNAEQVVEQFGIKEEDLANMPKAAQPKALRTELHPFQLQGLQWMLDKEEPQLPKRGTKDVVQLWQRHPTMPNAFTNLATCFSITNPELASGGILADDMGLGKTIQVISLILADRARKGAAPGVCGATLILAPVSVMSNWSFQMKKHIKEEFGLKIMFYHGTRKRPITPKTITDYDIVISTYDSVSSEWYSMKSTNLPRKSGVFSVTWRRVILDEAHQIRNPKAKRTIAATQLMAQSRWALTGTPIINNLKDLYSLVRFLRLTGGLDKFELFHGAIIRPVQNGDTKGNTALQLLMRSVCLRRKKEMSFIDLRLPELSEYVHKITLLPHEREKYNALEAQAKGTLDQYRQKIGKTGTNANDTYRHLLEVLLRMRQLCNHWKLVGEERIDSVLKQLDAEGVVNLTDENRQALQRMLQISIDSQEDCPICLESLREPVITKCGHIFCTFCLERVIDTQHRCPMCRAELESLETTTVKPAKETAAPPPPTQEQIQDREILEKESSSKVEALLSILKASAKDTTNKSIVFSQWTSFLDMLQPHLSAAGIRYTRIDGSMAAAQRDIALEALDADPCTTVMLASLSVCSVGLNLVAANQVIMSDSWWAPAIEDQAVDRVHRLGQKRETTVFRLVVEDSIEQTVLEIQEDKRKLMGLAFAEKEVRKAKKRGGAGLGDLERLLGGSDQARGAQSSSS